MSESIESVDWSRTTDWRQVHRLPALASEFFFAGEEGFGWGPTLKTILEGTRDEGSPFHQIRGIESLVKHIYTLVVSEWARHITLCIPASYVGYLIEGVIVRIPRGPRDKQENWGSNEEMPNLPRTSRFQASAPAADGGNGPTSAIPSRVGTEEQARREEEEEEECNYQGYVAFTSCGEVEFPEPADRNVNMLPFVFGDIDSLPLELQCYFELIEQCPYKSDGVNNQGSGSEDSETDDESQHGGDETGKVGYLTVHESYVDAESAQRREGLHIEAPGAFEDNACAMTPGVCHSWGAGVFWGPNRYEGGIYMSSSVADTSEVWDALVDKNVKGIVDKHGNCENLRPLLGPGTKLEANQLIWMTDCTPHEALPQPVGSYRQFFRVVTSHVTHWFAQHSTPNSRVAVPDHVTIVYDNKFE